LGWVFLDENPVSINQTLIDEGFAWSYMGETKIKNFEALLAKRKK
jgi:micrococcal nuclease